MARVPERLGRNMHIYLQFDPFFSFLLVKIYGQHFVLAQLRSHWRLCFLISMSSKKMENIAYNQKLVIRNRKYRFRISMLSKKIENTAYFQELLQYFLLFMVLDRKSVV